MENLKAFKKTFDKELERFFDKKIEEFLKKSDNSHFKDILLHTKKIALSGGKRIRPYVGLLSYATFGGKDEDEAVKLSLCLELFHIFALIHDDIIDNGKTRHGVDTLHCYIGNLLNCSDRNYGTSQAILIGDLIFSWSQECLPKKVKKYYYKMVNDTMLGQMIDVSLTLQKKVRDKEILQKMLLKTANYTFVYPMQMGASLANEGEEIFEFCKEFGESLGIAFQIKDDIKDIITTDKTSFSDIQKGQHTFLTQYIFEYGTKEQKKTLRMLFGRSLNEREKRLATLLFASSGAIAFANSQARKYLDQAKNALEKSSLNAKQKENLGRILKIYG